MIRKIAKKGKFVKGQRISIGRAPVKNFKMLTNFKDFSFDPQSGVITILKDIELNEPIVVEFDFTPPSEPLEPTEEERRRERLIQEKMRELAIRELRKEGKL